LTSQLNVRMAQDINSITQADLQNYKEQVSPIEYEKTLRKYIQDKKAFDQSTAEGGELIWSDPNSQARATDKTKNKKFDVLTQGVMKNEGKSRDDAEVQVALSAGGQIPVFLKSLHDKLTSGNPQHIESAANQIQQLRDAEGGRALIGLDAKAQAIGIQFNHQRGSMSDSDLARKITDNMANIDDSMQKTLDNAWNLKLSTSSASGPGATKSFASFALKEVGLKTNQLGGKYFETLYGNDIYDTLKSNFDAARGDYATALQMTKDYVNDKYGETRFNGSIQITDNPIEKALGYKDPDVVPFIQQNVLNNLSKSFEAHKEDKKGYWTVNPVQANTSNAGNPFQKNHAPAEVTFHAKTEKGEKQFRYPVNLVGRPGNEWDVVLQTPDGPRNIFLVASNLGVITYRPTEADRAEIDVNYHHYIKNRGWF
jgi:hypothetical protein